MALEITGLAAPSSRLPIDGESASPKDAKAAFRTLLYFASTATDSEADIAERVRFSG